VSTTAYTVGVVKLGDLWLEMRFEVLDENISTIFGMPFLEATNP
jgi:hypothetical protein